MKSGPHPYSLQGLFLSIILFHPSKIMSDAAKEPTKDAGPSNSFALKKGSHDESSVISSAKSKASRTRPPSEQEKHPPLKVPKHDAGTTTTHTLHLTKNYNGDSMSSMSHEENKNIDRAAHGEKDTPQRYIINGIYMRATDNEGRVIFVPEQNFTNDILTMNANPHAIEALKRLLTIYEAKVNKTCDDGSEIKTLVHSVQMDIYKSDMRINNVNHQLEEVRDRLSLLTEKMTKNEDFLIEKMTKIVDILIEKMTKNEEILNDITKKLQCM